MNAIAGLYDNPILRKHIRSRLRPQHLIPSVAVTVIICGSVWGGHLLGALNGHVFSILLAIEWAILLVLGTSQVAAAVSQAKDTGILDFHRVSPLPASWVTTGFLFGAPIREYLMFACTMPFAIVPAILGTPGMDGLVTIYPVLFASTVLFHMLAVLMGLVSKKPRGASGSVVAIVAFTHFIALRSLLGGTNVVGMLTVLPAHMMATRGLGPNEAMPGFFGVDMPIFVQSLIYQCVLIAFVYIAAVRKMRSDRAHAYSKPVATIFLATVAVLGVGSLWSTSAPTWLGRISPLWSVVVLLYVTVAAAVLLINSVTPSASDFGNGMRRATKLGRSQLPPWHDLAANHWVVAVFCVIVGSASGVVYWFLALPNSPDGSYWSALAVATLVVFYYGYARQYFELAFGRRAVPFFLLFLFLAWIVPLILGTIVSMTNWGGDASVPVLSVSPIVGIWTAAGLEGFGGAVRVSRSTNLPFSLTFALLFGLLAIHARRRAGQKLRDPVLIH